MPVAAGEGRLPEEAPPAGPLEVATCPLPFHDVRTTDYFYEGVRYLYCMGAVNGYGDNTFRPYAFMTRGQLSKLIVLAKRWPLNTAGGPHFRDVPREHPFYPYVETAYLRGAISGYSDGTFRANVSITRSQLAKIVVVAEGWPLVSPPNPTFRDVPGDSPFYAYVETAAARRAISGYSDATFRPGNPTTRGQVAKIVHAATFGFALTPQEQQTVDLINQRRAALGLGPLRVNLALTAAGRRHSADIGPRGLCQHTGTDGSSPWDRAAEAGYTGFAMGEVVGCGYHTPQGVVDAWWGSPAHFVILVDPAANDIGCGWWLSSTGAGWQTCVTGRSD